MLPNKLTATFLGPVLAVTSMAAIAAAEPRFDCTQDQIAFRTADGAVVFEIELADTPALREKGLMFRKNLPDNTGMLFVYESPRMASFWMRNTLTPLDMIFMDRSGVIRHIHPNAQPRDETIIPGAVPGDPDPRRQFIFEIAGGEAARLGLKVGQAMSSLVIDQTEAAWPCR